MSAPAVRQHTTRVLRRSDVRELLDMRACIQAVEDAFRQHALGRAIAPGVLGTHVDGGGFHVKTAGLHAADPESRPVFVAKVNANFPGNPARHELPTIQGVIALFDALDGRVLALLDSIEITSVRTAAATAVAAKYLAVPDASSVTICGCGEQSRHQLRGLACVRPVTRVAAFDTEGARADAFARDMTEELGIDVTAVTALGDVTRSSDLWVTCTPSRQWLLGREHVAPGAFVAAVGADNPEKQEIEPELLAASAVVADILDQSAAIGDLHHALAAGLMRRDDVRAELADVVSGRAPGRLTPDEIVVFDSTGIALQDVAAAALVYERALATGAGLSIALGDLGGMSAAARR
jgi:ornithine cyclodeaminase/alanine dehydrogenase-like protein (mu-crystallin family)